MKVIRAPFAALKRGGEKLSASRNRPADICSRRADVHNRPVCKRTDHMTKISHHGILYRSSFSARPN